MLKRSGVAILLLGAVSLSHAAPRDSGYFQYQLGGGAPIARAPNPTPTHVNLNASVDWSQAFACDGAFDPQAALESSFGGLENGFANLQTSIYGAATGAVAGLPMLQLQRIRPDWYDLIQKGFAMISADMKFAEASCQQVQTMMVDQGGIDYEQWVQVSTAQEWRTAMSSGSTDILSTKQEIGRPSNKGHSGVPWIGGSNAGGAGQQAIRPVRDVVRAGYNDLLNRSANSTTPASGAALATPLGGTWSSPAAASQWAVEVLGDQSISTYNGSAKSSQPGKGLITKYEQARDAIRPQLAALVDGSTPITDAALDDLSSATVPLSRPLIESIRKEPDAGAVVDRLASEIALAQTMDRAMHLKRMLMTGRREPNVYAQQHAVRDIDKALSELNSEMSSLMSEIDLRDRLAARTPTLLLDRDKARSAPGGVRPESSPGLRAGAPST